MTPAFGCVVLTAGRRPDDLRAAVESLQRQAGVETDVVVVANGCEPAVPDGVRVVALAFDEGIPAGRNAGVPHVRGELLFFLDDDAAIAAPDALVRVADRLAADPRLALVQLAPQARDGGPRSHRAEAEGVGTGDLCGDGAVTMSGPADRRSSLP